MLGAIRVGLGRQCLFQGVKSAENLPRLGQRQFARRYESAAAVASTHEAREIVQPLDDSWGRRGNGTLPSNKCMEF